MIIRKRAYPRAGLVGNPSDGYFGKTLSFTFTNFFAEVVLYESPELEILPNTRDHSVFHSVEALHRDVLLFGYYGGIRLLKAAVKRFFDYCRENKVSLHERNFSVRYYSNIPHMVGLAGSSAIITSCFRALQGFYDLSIPAPQQASLILSVERDELQIPAGLQDRVAQVYQGLVYMDFDKDLMEAQGHGSYERVDVGLLPPLYIAYRSDLSEGSEVFHSDIRGRFDRGEPEVVDAMAYWAELTDRARTCLVTGKGGDLRAIIDANYDRRSQLYKISDGNREMIEAARSVGASAKFTGSGGAIVGTYDDAAMFERLEAVLGAMAIRVLVPDVAAPEEVGS